MTVEYTVRAYIEAYDESLLKTGEDDVWYPDEEASLFVTNSLQKAKAFLQELPVQDD